MGFLGAFQLNCAHEVSSGSGESSVESTETLALHTLRGEPVKTGVPVESQGFILPEEQIHTSQHRVTDLPVFAEPLIQPNIYPYLKQIPFTAEIREISFGKGNFPPMETLPVETPEKHHFVPVITEALPFQNEIHEKLSYRNLGISQGLSSTMITSAFQDSRGYFWLGSKRGLTRYDGYSFQYYQFFSDDQQREIGAITEDKSGNIWMSFSSWGGLMMFDGVDFYEYQEDKNLHVGETYLGIIHTDSQGNIWLKSETKIIRFSGDRFTCFPYHFQNLKNLNILMKEGPQGSLWLSALGGVCRITEDKMEYYPLEEFGENNLCHPVVEDERGLIVTTGSGVTILKNDSLQIFLCPFMREHDLHNVLSVGKDFIVSSHSKRNALCSVGDSSMAVLSGNAPLLAGSLLMYTDNFNKIWFSSPGEGLQVYNTDGFKHFTFGKMSTEGHISSILQDRDGSMWFGSHGFGLYNYDGKNHTYYPLTSSTGLAIRALIQDYNGAIWVGTVDSGLFKIENAQTAEPVITRYKLFGDTTYSVFSLTEDHKQHLWIGTRTNGLLCYDGTDFKQYLNAAEDVVNSSNNIRALITDRQGHVWAGSQNGGVRKYDGQKFTWFSTMEGLSSNHVVSLAQDHLGNIWIGTSDQGVNKYDGHSFASITISDGLSSNAIWTITEDNAGNIWLGADNSLNVLIADPVTGEIGDKPIVKTYRNMDGLEGAEFYANASVRDKSGQLWWGTEQMAVMISNPVSLVNQQNISLSLESIQVVNNRFDFKQLRDSIQAGKDWFLSGDPEMNLASISFGEITPFTNYPENLELPPYLNDLTFIYRINQTANPGDVEFSYYMQGIDKDWSIPGKSNRIDYRGLHPGTYTLQARVSEVKGIWSEPFTYSFVILPYWWQTWWAYLLWAALLVAALVLIFLYSNKRRKEREDANRIREIEALKSQFYSNITHEFRTPLTLIMGMTSEIGGHEKQREIILRNSEKLLQQINQLLDAAKLESGNLVLNLQQSDIVLYLRFLLESFVNYATDKGVQLTFYTEIQEFKMDFDQEKIQGIIYNLLSNAIKFTPAGGKIIFHVSAQNQDGNKWLRIKIKDTGVGIPAEQIPRIYDRFYQVQQADKNNSSGTGLGLALTKDLVALMKGKIEVQSVVNSGTEFTVLIPVSNQAPVVQNATFERPLGLGTNNIDSASEGESITDQDALTVLIIEDNKEIASFLAMILKSTYRIITAENGLTGIQKAFEYVPDAVISDIAMPELTGYEVCDRLKTDERTSHIPVILLTAKVAQADRVEGLKRGADAYLTKPFHREELEIILQKLIALRQQLQKRYAGTIQEPVNQQEEQEFILEDAFIQKLTALVTEFMADSDFGVPELAKKSGLSQMQIYRKLKALTNKTPSQFIRSCRLNKAVELLKSTDLNVSEIAYEVGFSDPNYFSRTFHQEFGAPPAQYRK